ncbi:MAG: hypothetical protein J6K13_01360 [Clostridia bacterium]|nr:hypothetical protein [Clostridia bacterium]
MLDHTGRYTIENYGRMEPFCSFLPGIGGEKGVPMWCYYVNRGQCVSSFGIEDKDHAIMEFFPAHQAYQYTSRVGWRTFLKVNGAFVEPFADAATPQAMHIGMNDLRITDTVAGLKMDVTYFTLPEERAAALVRKVTITNTTNAPMAIDMLDGMPALLPFGLNLHSVKHMTQTAKAWLQAEETHGPITFYRTRASMEDTSDVQQVLGVNFSTALVEEGGQVQVYVDPRHVFGYDTALEKPRGFLDKPYAQWAAMPEVTQNIIPCCFYGRQLTLQGGESTSHMIVVGQAESKDRARAACQRLTWPVLEQKLLRADEMAWQLTDAIASKTADPVFDMYSRQTYLDNLLRGGTPVTLPGGKVVYLYSRKHGDPERDYNAFRMRPEYYSQGNGNFRDVNQNRRCDVLFTPQVAQRNIRMFYSLLQLDGYNPLVVEYVQYTLDAAAQSKLLSLVEESSRADAAKLLSGTFTPGQLAMAAEDWALACPAEEFFAQAIAMSQEGVTATFGEGYWSDHWTYNLDQIETYASVYPENEEQLLYGDDSFTWFLSPETLLPRAKRYVATDRGVRQYAFLEKRPVDGSLQKDAQGQVLHATLMEKLLTLLAAKTATLDPYGMGVEMEGGKPGWYDALNGLPGLLGSSMPEALELARVLDYTLARARQYGRSVNLLAEAAQLARAITAVLKDTEATWRKEGEILSVWNALCDAKEAYRAQVRERVSGEKVELSAEEIADMLELWSAYVHQGVAKAMAIGGGLCPTYFAYDVTSYTQDEAGLHPTAFALRPMPNFLEGQVRYLRLNLPMEEKHRLVDAVRRSRLYDQKLNMYKVNAALGEASYEIGRAHAFTPGWLENESVWLHMEYKYLLELLRAGLYQDFMADFHLAAVPFLDPAMYGRSPLENSSFIASSANPDPAIHGKGFVARLSGSTAEFLSIWQIMMLGETLFTLQDGQLALTLLPLLPEYLTRGCETIEATLLGKTKVVYHIQPGKAYIPGQYALADAAVTWQDGTEETFSAGVIAGSAAQRIRGQEAREIHITLK